MMKKQEFLDELKGYLQVLEDEEQEDILQEYEQHIEMKIEKGQSEEEAIRDFGSIRELASEVLEAYHVKLDKQEVVTKPIWKKRSKEQWIKPFISAIFWVKAGAVKGGTGLMKGVGRLWTIVRKPFVLMGQNLRNGKGGIQKKQMLPVDRQEKKRKKKGVVFSMMISGLKCIFYGITNAVCWGGRMVWNCAVVCASAFSAFFGLICLYLFGAALVLWLQGYPLGGVLLGILGAVLCFMSLAVFGSTFYRRKPNVLKIRKNSAEQGSIVGQGRIAGQERSSGQERYVNWKKTAANEQAMAGLDCGLEKKNFEKEESRKKEER